MTVVWWPVLLFAVIMLISVAVEMTTKKNILSYRRASDKFSLKLKTVYFMVISFIRNEIPNIITVFGLGMLYIQTATNFLDKKPAASYSFYENIIANSGTFTIIVIVVYSVAVIFSNQREISDYKEIRNSITADVGLDGDILPEHPSFMLLVSFWIVKTIIFIPILFTFGNLALATLG